MTQMTNSAVTAAAEAFFNGDEPAPLRGLRRFEGLSGGDIVLALNQAAWIVLRCYVSEPQIARQVAK